jgi:hypothetical protein
MGAYFKADGEELITKKPTNYLKQFLSKVCFCLGTVLIELLKAVFGIPEGFSPEMVCS